MGQAAIMGMLSAWNPGAKPQAAVSGMASPATADTTQSSSSAADAGTGITANDFLTLLVTEMQNQDPTADVDPNAYINQLVQINSLEQLISINQNITSLGSGSSSGTGTGSGTGSGAGTGAVAPSTGVTGSAMTAGPGVLPSRAAAPLNASQNQTQAAAAIRASAKVVHGNMSVPPISGAAETVAGALAHPAVIHSARPEADGHAIRDIPLARFPGGSR
jgi:flagellar basal-body rod modification protein FlgD